MTLRLSSRHTRRPVTAARRVSPTALHADMAKAALVRARGKRLGSAMDRRIVYRIGTRQHPVSGTDTHISECDPLGTAKGADAAHPPPSAHAVSGS